MQSARIGTLLVLVTLLSACSKGGNEGSTQATASAQKPYDLTQDESDKLRSVDCGRSGTTFTCSRPGVSDESRLNDLNARVKFETNRKQIMADLSVGLEAKLNSGKLKGKEDDLRILIDTLKNYGPLQDKDIAADEDAIAHETLYQWVQGFNCGGNAGEQKISELIMFPKGQDAGEISKTVFDSEALKATFKFDMKKKNISWKSVENEKTSATNYWISSDGEFELSKSSGLQAQVTCFKARAGGSSNTQFTDRALAKRSMICHSFVANYQPPTKHDVNYMKMDEDFEVHSADKNQVIEIGLRRSNNVNDPVPNMKYLTRVTSNQGQLQFAIFEQQSGATVLEATTMNSVPNITLVFKDSAGNAARLDCASKPKQ